MAAEFAKDCDIGQGYAFKPNEHHTFGYLTQLIMGDNVVTPDIRVDASGFVGAPSAAVAVLANTTWSTLPTENIAFKARISVANMQLLNMLAMQSLKSVVFKVAFVVYAYDAVNQIYHPCFRSYAGTAPTGVPKPPPSDPAVLFAKLGKTASDPGLKIGSAPQEDPLGVVNYTLDLTLAPPIAKSPQQVLIQTSAKNKLIQPWGIPQG